MFKKYLKTFCVHQIKFLRFGSNTAYSLRFKEFGEPLDVLELVKCDLGKLSDTDVLVEVLAAPINPSDVNTIQGKYAIKPKLPAVAGNECVGKVVCVGAAVKSIKIGDHVVTVVPGLGTWTTLAKWHEKDIKVIPNKIGLADAATLTVNPCTAYRMLKDFVKLQPGDTVIQNGANSAVGQAVHQICRINKINSVGVVRERPNIEELKEELKCLGATEVFTDKEIAKATIFKDGKIKKPKLGLNCVGGQIASDITRHLDFRGILVTYGGMSMKPVIAPTGPLIFKDLKFCGFWVTRWMKENLDKEPHKNMFKELITYLEKGEFVAPKHKMISLENYKEAADAFCFTGFSGHKILFDMINFKEPK